jgi:hypothetical protein
MARGLTARSVETLRPGAVRREVPDRYLPGLYLIIQPSSAKSWAIRYRHGGITRKFTIGSFPAYDLKAAREAGAKALRAVAEGRDPGVEREQARAAIPRSVNAVIEQFVEKHCRQSSRRKASMEALLRKHVLPRWHGRTIDSISKRDVLDMLDGVVEGGAPIAANRALGAVRRFFNWCIERDILATSPCAGVKPPSPEQSRDRILSDDELKQVWHAADQEPGQFGPLVKLLILTGQRRSEVAHMTWAELDLPNRLWTLPRERTKNYERHEVPLS